MIIKNGPARRAVFYYFCDFWNYGRLNNKYNPMDALVTIPILF